MPPPPSPPCPPILPPPVLPPSLLLSFSTNGAPFFPSPSRRARGCRSLYTRSVAVLNVLFLLMPRSVCPRGRTTNEHFCPPPSFSCGPILSYMLPRIYRSESFSKGPREMRGRKRRERVKARPEMECKTEIGLGCATACRSIERRQGKTKRTVLV